MAVDSRDVKREIDKAEGAVKATVDQAADGAKAAVDRASSEAASLGERAKEAGAALLDKGADLIDRSSGLREAAADKAEQLRDSLHDAGARLKDTLRRAGDRDELRSMQDHVTAAVSSGIGVAADALRDGRVGEVAQDMHAAARRNPMPFILGAALAGFVVGRYMMAQRPEPKDKYGRRASR